MAVSPIDLLCAFGHEVDPALSRGSEAMANRPIVMEESFLKSRWSPEVEEGAESQSVVEVVWWRLTRFPATLSASLAGHGGRCVLKKSKDVQRQSPVDLSFPADLDHRSAWT